MEKNSAEERQYVLMNTCDEQSRNAMRHPGLDRAQVSPTPSLTTR